MSALYYVLGAVAKLNARMWLYRINFLPINVLLIAGLGFGAFATAGDAVESMHNASTPRKLSVAQIGAGPVAQNYVAVQGLDVHVALYEYGETNSAGDVTTVTQSWTPLLDRETQRILLVKHPGKVTEGEPQVATVTGMLRPLAPDLRSKLAARHDTVEGRPVETRYMLVTGEKPANSAQSAVISLVLFAVVALFVFAAVKRNTIFQRAEFGSPVSKLKTVDQLIVRGTGTYGLEQNGKVTEQRFIEMNSVLALLDNGNPALLSNIDASSRFMGVKTSDRAGIWAVPIHAGSVRDAQAGFVYWGTKRRPAYRFTYTSARAAKRQAIISADDLTSLSAAVALLTTAPVSQGAPAT